MSHRYKMAVYTIINEKQIETFFNTDTVIFSLSNHTWINMAKRVIIPLPHTDFDPTEAGVSWKCLTDRGVDVVFATPSGLVATCDPIMLTGKGLSFLSPMLRADKYGRAAYDEMAASREFKNPIKWSHLKQENFDGLLLPGGHAKGMLEYLESNLLKQIVVDFFSIEKPVGAICHGVLLAARSHYHNGKSVLFGRKTTALIALQELTAWALTAAWMKDYYRTYPQTLEAEVKSNLANSSDFIKGPMPLYRDNPAQLERGFTVRDKNYLSARWPGDTHRFANQFFELL